MQLYCCQQWPNDFRFSVPSFAKQHAKGLVIIKTLGIFDVIRLLPAPTALVGYSPPTSLLHFFTHIPIEHPHKLQFYFLILSRNRLVGSRWPFAIVTLHVIPAILWSQQFSIWLTLLFAAFSLFLTAIRGYVYDFPTLPPISFTARSFSYCFCASRSNRICLEISHLKNA